MQQVKDLAPVEHLQPRTHVEAETETTEHSGRTGHPPPRTSDTATVGGKRGSPPRALERPTPQQARPYIVQATRAAKDTTRPGISRAVRLPDTHVQPSLLRYSTLRSPKERTLASKRDLWLCLLATDMRSVRAAALRHVERAKNPHTAEQKFRKECKFGKVTTNNDFDFCQV